MKQPLWKILDPIEKAATQGKWSMYDGYGPTKDGNHHCVRIGTDTHTAIHASHSGELKGRAETFELIATSRNHMRKILDLLKDADVLRRNGLSRSTGGDPGMCFDEFDRDVERNRKGTVVVDATAWDKFILSVAALDIEVEA